jgi:hypothetical protein
MPDMNAVRGLWQGNDEGFDSMTPNFGVRGGDSSKGANRLELAVRRHWTMSNRIDVG